MPSEKVLLIGDPRLRLISEPMSNISDSACLDEKDKLQNTLEEL
jgi:hypothetical protein